MRALALVIVAAAAVASCNVIFGIEKLEPLPGAGGGAAAGPGGSSTTVAMGGAGAGGAGGGGGCAIVAEICGNGLDDDCDGQDDATQCGGLGTFVSAGVGDDGNPGTQEAPMRSIGAGIQQAQAILDLPSYGHALIGVYIGEGSYAEKVVVVPSVSLIGGYQCTAATCDWTRDPTMYVASIEDVDEEGVLAGAGVMRDTRIDGMRIVGFPTAAVPMGEIGAALRLIDGSPTVTDCTIEGATIDCVSFCSGAAIAVGGTPADPDGALITGNVVLGGTGPSAGGAITAATSVEIRQNRMSGGTFSYARGLMLSPTAGATVKVVDNDVEAPNCPTGGTAFAITVLGAGDAVLDGNRVNLDAATVGACNGNLTGWSGGIEIQGGDGSRTITNNVVAGIAAPKSAALVLFNAEGAAPSTAVNGNVLLGDGKAGTGTVSAALVLRAGTGNTVIMGRVRNNLFFDGGNGDSDYCVYEDSTAMKTCKPEALENNAFGSCGVEYRQWDGSSGTDLTSMAAVEGLAFAAGNFASDCDIDASFHLPPSSACIDAGIASEAPPSDFEGDSRPQGAAVDVGADEAL
jgi:hypothetical protein